MEMINAIGRRKASIARVYLTKGEGNITVNGKDYKAFFPQTHIQSNITDPFKTCHWRTLVFVVADQVDDYGHSGEGTSAPTTRTRRLQP